MPGCHITKEGFKSLADALGSNPSHIRNLDLSHNCPEDKDMKLISGIDESSLEVKLDRGGESRIKSGLRKYACQLTLDSKTANGRLLLSEDNRQVSWVEEKQEYPEHPGQFNHVSQILCKEGLSEERFYWEVRTGNGTYIGVTHKAKTLDQGWNTVWTK